MVRLGQLYSGRGGGCTPPGLAPQEAPVERPQSITPCSVDGCLRAAKARGWCHAHYTHWHRTGDPGPAFPERFPPLVRFGQYAVAQGDCLEWVGVRNSQGYGQFGVGRRHYLAHRWLYENVIGPLPRELELDHLCRNRACVKLAHLEPVTHRENMRRGVAAVAVWRSTASAVAAYSAQRRAETYCPQGHEWAAGNEYESPQGHRMCRSCLRGRERERRRQAAAKRGA